MMRAFHCLGPRMCRVRALLPLVVAATLLCGALLLNRTQLTTAKPPWLDIKSCSPRSNIAFLKTHKCASSAIQNILFRYGDKHYLHFVMPDMGNYFGGGTRMFKADMVLSSPLSKLTPNIFAIHTKWDHAEEKLMMTLQQYVKQVAVDAERFHGFLGYNQMTWDFGMSREDMNNLTAVRELVRRADEQFGLVLVAERMEESLVLLAKYLCWELSDVLVLKLNSLRDEFKTAISEETRQVLQQKLAPDYLLYNHFLERFDQHVEAFGRGRMAAAVARLRELMALLVDTCDFVQKEAKELNGTQRPWSNKVDGFVGEGGRGCDKYILTEHSYIDVLRKRQRKEVARKFGLPRGPPMNAIPLGMSGNQRISERDLRKLKRTLIHKDNFEKRDGMREAGTAGGVSRTVDDERDV